MLSLGVILCFGEERTCQPGKEEGDSGPNKNFSSLANTNAKSGSWSRTALCIATGEGLTVCVALLQQRNWVPGRQQAGRESILNMAQIAHAISSLEIFKIHLGRGLSPLL